MRKELVLPGCMLSEPEIQHVLIVHLLYFFVSRDLILKHLVVVAQCWENQCIGEILSQGFHLIDNTRLHMIPVVHEDIP
jgi:hypothetical protein